MKRVKLIIIFALLLSLFIPSQLLAKGKEQKIKGQAKVNLRSAILYAREKKVDKALSFYMKVIEEYPDHVFSLFNVAVIYNNQALETPEKSTELYALSADYYQRTLTSINNIPDYKDYDEFEKYREESIKMLRNQWNRQFKNAYDFFAEEKYDESMAILNKLAVETPDSLKTYQLLAAISEKKGDKAKQNEYFKIILQKNPNDTIVLLNLANDYYMDKKYELAVEYFTKLSDLEPNVPDHPLYAGYSYIELKKIDLALQAFEKALSIDPNNTDALGTAASIAQNEGKNDKATEYLTRLVNLDDSLENLSILCYHLAKLQDWNALIPMAEKWYNKDTSKKEPVQLLVMAAIQTKNKALETKYTAILKKK